MHESEFFTIREFADLCGFTRNYLYQLWRVNKGPVRMTLHVGGQPKVRIPLRSGLEWIAKHYPERFGAYERLDDILRFDRFGFVSEIHIRERQR